MSSFLEWLKFVLIVAVAIFLVFPIFHAMLSVRRSVQAFRRSSAQGPHLFRGRDDRCWPPALASASAGSARTQSVLAERVCSGRPKMEAARVVDHLISHWRLLRVCPRSPPRPSSYQAGPPLAGLAALASTRSLCRARAKQRRRRW